MFLNLIEILRELISGQRNEKSELVIRLELISLHKCYYMISVELKGNRRKTGSIEMYDLNDFVIITYIARVLYKYSPTRRNSMEN